MTTHVEQRTLCAPRREITIRLIRREDDGLRIYSEDVPGLILSGPDPDEVMANVLPALQELKAWGER